MNATTPQGRMQGRDRIPERDERRLPDTVEVRLPDGTRTVGKVVGNRTRFPKVAICLHGVTLTFEVCTDTLIRAHERGRAILY